MRTRAALRAVHFQLAVRARVARSAVVLHNAVRTRRADFAHALHLAVRAPDALHAVPLDLSVRATAALDALRFSRTVRARGADRTVPLVLFMRAPLPEGRDVRKRAVAEFPEHRHRALRGGRRLRSGAQKATTKETVTEVAIGVCTEARLTPCLHEFSQQICHFSFAQRLCIAPPVAPIAPAMGPPVKRQATLHQLGKVQTSRSSSYWNVNIEDIEAHKKTLTNVGTSKEKFVAALRQLSSMLLTKDLLEQSMIGVCMNKIAKKHPDGEMRTLAKGIVEKWRKEVKGQVARDEKKKRTIAGWRKPSR